MGAPLSKTRTVLHRLPEPWTHTFVQEDDGYEVRGHLITVDEGVLEDMGFPDVITVTIEPGDLLNG